MYTRVNPVQAKLNCARLFKEKAHLRDPSIVDHYIAKGYDALSEAEQHYCQNTHVFQFLSPKVKLYYLYYNEKKYNNKFLKTSYCFEDWHSW